MPQTKNIAVLGAGITGLYCAYTLSRRGHRVTIYDPSGFGGQNASWMAGGMLAPYSEIEHMDARWVQAGLDSLELWRETPLDCGFRQDGSLLVAHPEDHHMLERFAAHLPAGLKNTRRKPQELEPDLPEKFRTGLYLSEEAHIEPRRALAALGRHLQDKVTLVTSRAAPEDITADCCIDARGMAMDDPDLRGVKGEILVVRNPEFTLTRPLRLMHPRYPLYIVPRPDHVFMIGATIIESDEGQHVALRSAMELMSALYSLHPGFGEAEILELSCGIRPSYPDNLPRITQDGTIFRVGGMFRHGFLLAPIMAQVLSDNIDGRSNQNRSLFTHDAKPHQTDDQRAAKGF